MDDAYISLRIARNWVELGAPVFNAFELGPGGQPVEGFSNLLWTALLAALYQAGASFPDFLGPLQLSLAMGVLIVQLRFVTSELRLGRAGECASVVLLATSAPFVAWSTGGMETTLFTLLLTAFSVGLLRKELSSRSDLLQLALNGAWSWLFFGLHRPLWALVEILCLWVAILATTIAFLAKDRIAGWLLVPYLAWVSFASFLNYTLWQLNG